MKLTKITSLNARYVARLAKDTAALHNSEKRRTERRERRLAKRVAEQSLTPEEVEVERINGLHRKERRLFVATRALRIRYEGAFEEARSLRY